MIYNVIAILVLVPIIGVIGAAIAHGTAQLIKNLFIWWHVRRTARWTNFGGVVVASLLIWGCVLGAGYGLKVTLELPAILHMAFGVILCAAGWLIYVRSPVLSASDRDILANVLRGREARLLQWLRVFPERQRAK